VVERKGRATKSVRNQYTDDIAEKEPNGEVVKCGAR
jgi:hypothetical protein